MTNNDTFADPNACPHRLLFGEDCAKCKRTETTNSPITDRRMDNEDQELDKHFRSWVVKRIRSRCSEYPKERRLDNGRLIQEIVWPHKSTLTQDEIMMLLVEVWEVRGAANLFSKLAKFREDFGAVE